MVGIILLRISLWNYPGRKKQPHHILRPLAFEMAHTLWSVSLSVNPVLTYLSPNSFCEETSRACTSLRSEKRCAILIKSPHVGSGQFKSWYMGCRVSEAPLPGPESGLLSNTQKWNVTRDTGADRARGLLERGTWVGGSRAREPRRAAPPRGSSFMVMGLVGGLSLAHLSDSGSFLEAHHTCLPRWIPVWGILGGRQDVSSLASSQTLVKSPS